MPTIGAAAAGLTIVSFLHRRAAAMRYSAFFRTPRPTAYDRLTSIFLGEESTQCEQNWPPNARAIRSV